MAVVERISSELGNDPFCAIDSAFCESPFHLRKLQLCLFGLLRLALRPEVVDFDAILRVQVCDTSDGSSSADSESWNKPVTLACKSAKLIGRELGTDSGYLGDTTACQLDANDVGMAAELREHIGVDIESSDDSGKVVDQNGNGRGIGKLEIGSEYERATD